MYVISIWHLKYCYILFLLLHFFNDSNFFFISIFPYHITTAQCTSIMTVNYHSMTTYQHLMTTLEALLYRTQKENELNNIEINHLKEKCQLQDNILKNATDEVILLKKQVAQLTALQKNSGIVHLNESNGPLNGNAVTTIRKTRSVDGPSSASSWSKLQISPDELGSMPYGHYGLNIYGHSGNSLQSTNATKRYYYTPICKLNHRSAISSFNNVTRQPEVRFRIEMWTMLWKKKWPNTPLGWLVILLRTNRSGFSHLRKSYFPVNRLPQLITKHPKFGLSTNVTDTCGSLLHALRW